MSDNLCYMSFLVLWVWSIYYIGLLGAQVDSKEGCCCMVLHKEWRNRRVLRDGLNNLLQFFKFLVICRPVMEMVVKHLYIGVVWVPFCSSWLSLQQFSQKDIIQCEKLKISVFHSEFMVLSGFEDYIVRVYHSNLSVHMLFMIFTNRH